MNFRSLSFGHFFVFVTIMHASLILTWSTLVKPDKQLSQKSALSLLLLKESSQPILNAKRTEKKIRAQKNKAKSTSHVIQANRIQPKKTKINFLEDLRLLIEKKKYYPKNARLLGQNGDVVVTFDLLRNGVITNIRILSSSRYPLLDQAALKTIKEVGKFKPFPKDLSASYLNLVQKISFRN